MILVHIETIKEQQAMDIVDFLEKEELIVDALILNGTKRAKNKEKTSSQSIFLIQGKTKALLFDTIDIELRHQYPDSLPSIYATPIVYMDWDQTIELKEKTAKI